MEHFKIVEKAFYAEIDRVFSEKPGIHTWIKNHERIPKLMDNLKSEIVTTEIKKASLINQASLAMIGKEFAHTFAKLAIENKENLLMSETEKQRRLHEKHEWDEIGKMIEEDQETTESLNSDGSIERTRS